MLASCVRVEMRRTDVTLCVQVEMRDLQQDIATLQSLLREHGDCFQPSSTVPTSHA